MIKELLGHAHIGVNATAYVGLRLHRDAIGTLSTALDGPTITDATKRDGDEAPPCAALVR